MIVPATAGHARTLIVVPATAGHARTLIIVPAKAGHARTLNAPLTGPRALPRSPVPR